MRLTRTQISKAQKSMKALLNSAANPKARFLTDEDGWVIEVEHLEIEGERKLRELLAAGRMDGDALSYEADGQTGKAQGNQYYLAGIRNGTYAVKVTVRDRSAINVF